jgi:L-ascorbate metabolism protein UlaG (beta-lactamase superfamily)
MKYFILLLMCLGLSAGTMISADDAFSSDVLKTSQGDLKMTFIGHGTLMFTLNDKYVIHIDPVSREADYSQLPKADLVLITHEHGDHLDPSALSVLRKPDTQIFLTEGCLGKFPDGKVMHNGDSTTWQGIRIEAVPAYNIKHMRGAGSPYHPKGSGNGYVLTIGDTRIYIAGDTENIPEMKALRDIDVAFLPMNLPYTMSPEMAADAAKSFNPKFLYPYHYGQTDPQKLVDLLKDQSGIEVRIRELR